MKRVRDKLIKAQEKLRVVAISLTGDINDAEDLLQETSLRILNCAECYRNDDNFEGWAVTVMKNIFKNSLRGKNGLGRLFCDGYDGCEHDSLHEVNDTEAAYIAKETMEEISRLPTLQSQLLAMRIAGYHYDEMAYEMNIPVGYVKSSLHKAKMNLLKRLEN